MEAASPLRAERRRPFQRGPAPVVQLEVTFERRDGVVGIVDGAEVEAELLDGAPLTAYLGAKVCGAGREPVVPGHPLEADERQDLLDILDVPDSIGCGRKCP